MSILVKEALSAAEKDSVYRLRYKVFVEELSLYPEHAFHDTKELKEPTDEHAHNFLATENGNAVGALRINLIKDGPLPHEGLYTLGGLKPYYPDQVALLSKFTISKSQNGGKIAKELLKACYDLSRKNKCQFIILDCWPHLVSLFEHLGFRQFMSNIDHPENGYTTPMLLITEDTDHFDAICSPFIELAVNYKNSPEATDHFARQYPSHAQKKIKISITNDDTFDLISEKISTSIGDTVNLFKSMSKEEIQLITSLGKIKKYKPGDKIITFGDTKNEIYTLLSGEVEVCHEIEGQTNHICNFSEGETFGEVAFLADTTRSSDVIARTNAEVLIHNSDNLSNLEKNFPVIAAKIYRNLARIVSVRLIKTSQTSSSLRASLKYHLALKLKNR